MSSEPSAAKPLPELLAAVHILFSTLCLHGNVNTCELCIAEFIASREQALREELHAANSVLNRAHEGLEVWNAKQQRVRELVGKWRKAAQILPSLNADISAETMSECADELAATLDGVKTK